MSNAIDTKKVVVDEITSKFKDSMSTVIVDYRGLSVSEVTELRKQLRDAGVEFKVYKNTLTRRAVEQVELTGLNDFLTGPNAIAFSNEDVIAPAKIINEFAKSHEALEIKAGVIEGNVATVEEVKALRNFRLAKAYYLCCLAFFKLQFVTLLLLLKQLQIKKKNKALNAYLT